MRMDLTAASTDANDVLTPVHSVSTDISAVSS
jgi:hypothetical protein